MPKPKPLVKTLPIDTLYRTHALQARVRGTNVDHIEDLGLFLKGGNPKEKDTALMQKNLNKLPPVKVVLVQGTGPCVVDGHHTIGAAELCGLSHVRCEITEGTMAEAVLAAAGANAQHNALKRSNADKRKAVEMALSVLPKGTSGAEVARIVGDVSDQYVRDIKRELSGTDDEGPALKPRSTATTPASSASSAAESKRLDSEPEPEPVKASPKSGKPVMDRKAIEAKLGTWNKFLAEVAKATGSEKSAEFKGIERIMSECEEAIKAWVKSVNSAKG